MGSPVIPISANACAMTALMVAWFLWASRNSCAPRSAGISVWSDFSTSCRKRASSCSMRVIRRANSSSVVAIMFHLHVLYSTDKGTDVLCYIHESVSRRALASWRSSVREESLLRQPQDAGFHCIAEPKVQLEQSIEQRCKRWDIPLLLRFEKHPRCAGDADV